MTAYHSVCDYHHMFTITAEQNITPTVVAAGLAVVVKQDKSLHSESNFQLLFICIFY